MQTPTDPSLRYSCLQQSSVVLWRHTDKHCDVTSADCSQDVSKAPKTGHVHHPIVVKSITFYLSVQINGIMTIECIVILFGIFFLYFLWKNCVGKCPTKNRLQKEPGLNHLDHSNQYHKQYYMAWISSGHVHIHKDV